MLIRSITRARKKKPCCGGCAGGKPCCGDKAKLPRPRLPAFARHAIGDKTLLLPRRDLSIPKALLQYPSEAEWGGLWRPWTPALATFDLSCMPCCGTCDCSTLPTFLHADVTATTGGCATLLGCGCILTKITDHVWTGTLSGCGCNTINLTWTCISFPTTVTIEATLNVDACPTSFNSPALSGHCDPLESVHVFPVDVADIFCTCCPGGGTYTITVTEP